MSVVEETPAADGRPGGDGRPGAATAPGQRPAAERPLTIVSPKVDLRQRLRAIWRYRELLVGMTRKELRVQYKDSALGFAWSMLNPATTLLVYFVVFQLILKNNIPRFAIYLMCGVLVWNFFSVGVSAACGSVVGNSSIIKKVAFPREIPALATLGSALVQMGLQSIVLVIFLLAFRNAPALAYLPDLIPALAALLALAAALGVLFAAINVRMRDMQHLLGVALMVWMWATPIVYQYRLVSDKVAADSSGAHGLFVHVLFVIWRLNPITPIVLTFQRAIYAATSPHIAGGGVVHVLPDAAGPWWYCWQDLAVLGFSLALFAFALKVFGRFEGNFAEEL